MIFRALALACAGVLVVPAVAHAESPVRRAEKRVEVAQQDLKEARATARDLIDQADSAKTDARAAQRDLGNFAREAYATGSNEMLGIASLIDSPNPSDTMRRASVAQRLTEHQDAQVADALATLDDVGVLRQQAEVIVSQAETQLKAAKSSLKAVKGNRDLLGTVANGASSGDGVRELAALCLKADVVVDLCATPKWSEAHLTRDTVIIGRYVHITWPEVKEVGGWRPSDPYPDHPSGRAADIMMPHGGATAGDVKLGNEIAEYFQKHAADYGIYYMIWRQRIWKASDPVGQWTGMSDRGSPTANHMDHVHISVTDGTSGSGFDLGVLRAGQAEKSLPTR
ncbi:MAG: hypothetical protein U0R64_02425 [Candidatus Nanopelagicales bacterium]